MFLDKQKTYCSQQSENSQPKQGISEISFIRRILIKEKLRFCAKARLERVKLHTNSPDQVVLTQKTAKIPDEFQNELQVCTKWSADKQGVCKAQFFSKHVQGGLNQ